MKKLIAIILSLVSLNLLAQDVELTEQSTKNTTELTSLFPYFEMGNDTVMYNIQGEYLMPFIKSGTLIYPRSTSYNLLLGTNSMVSGGVKLTVVGTSIFTDHMYLGPAKSMFLGSARIFTTDPSGGGDLYFSSPTSGTFSLSELATGTASSGTGDVSVYGTPSNKSLPYWYGADSTISWIPHVSYLNANTLQFTTSSADTALYITNDGSGTGALIRNTSSGVGMKFTNTGTGAGLEINKSGTGKGMYINNTSGSAAGLDIYNNALSQTATGIYVQNYTGGAGTKGVYIGNNDIDAVGLYILNQQGNGIEIVSADSTAIKINVADGDKGIDLLTTSGTPDLLIARNVTDTILKISNDALYAPYLVNDTLGFMVIDTITGELKAGILEPVFWGLTDPLIDFKEWLRDTVNKEIKWRYVKNGEIKESYGLPGGMDNFESLQYTVEMLIRDNVRQDSIITAQSREIELLKEQNPENVNTWLVIIASFLLISIGLLCYLIGRRK